MKGTLTILLISLITLSLTAKQQTAETIAIKLQSDTTATISFLPGKNIFYLTYKENAANVKILEEFISQHLNLIQNGNIYVKVNGYCSSFTNQQDNLSAAKERSNRVKSYLIIHKKLGEQNFITRNSTKKINGRSDIVNISYLIKNKQANKKTIAFKQDSTLNLTHNREIVTQNIVSQEEKQAEKTESEPAPLLQDSIITKHPTLEKIKRNFTIALKTNLLFDLALAPNVELELPLGKKWGALVNPCVKPYNFFYFCRENTKYYVIRVIGFTGFC